MNLSSLGEFEEVFGPPVRYAPGEVVQQEVELPRRWWERLLRRPARRVTRLYVARVTRVRRGELG